MATPTLAPTFMPTKSNPFNTSSSDWAEIRVTLLLNAFMAVVSRRRRGVLRQSIKRLRAEAAAADECDKKRPARI